MWLLAASARLRQRALQLPGHMASWYGSVDQPSARRQWELSLFFFTFWQDSVGNMLQLYMVGKIPATRSARQAIFSIILDLRPNFRSLFLL